MPRTSFLDFVRRQWRTIPPVRSADLTGKTVIVIGANTGIGFETAKHFATMNAGRLILGCRSRERGELAVLRLQKETGYTRAELWLIDLAEFQSVKAFANKFEEEGGRLDYLILNAGMATETYTATVDGYESTIQVNCLAPSLLALLLLPRMIIETAKNYSVMPRIVVVSSGTHRWTTFDDQVLSSQSPLQLLGSKEYCTEEVMKGRRYPDSKLLNVFFVRGLSGQLRSQIIVNAVDPGFCVSELRRNVGGMRAVIFKVMEVLLAWTAEQGSRNLIYAALAGSDRKEEEPNLHGAYISIFEIAEPSEFVSSDQGKEMQDKLWKETLDILSKVDPRVPTIVQKYLS